MKILWLIIQHEKLFLFSFCTKSIRKIKFEPLMSHVLFCWCPCYVSEPGNIVVVLLSMEGLRENILICVLKMNEGLRGLERHAKVNKSRQNLNFWVNYPFKHIQCLTNVLTVIGRLNYKKVLLLFFCLSCTTVYSWITTCIWNDAGTKECTHTGGWTITEI